MIIISVINFEKEHEVMLLEFMNVYIHDTLVIKFKNNGCVMINITGNQVDR